MGCRRAPVHRPDVLAGRNLGSGQCPTCGIACRQPGGGSRALGSERVTAGGKEMRMLKHKALAAAVAVTGSLVVAGAATAAPPIDSSPLRNAVTVAGIMEHQAALEAIANANEFEGVPTRA